MYRRLSLPLLLLAVLALAAFGMALMVGSASLSISDVWAVVQGSGDGLARTMVIELRLPRALSAFAVGGLLAVAGALMQVLLRNPWRTLTCWGFPAVPRLARWGRCWQDSAVC